MQPGAPLVVLCLFAALLRQVLRPGEEVIQEVQTGIVHVLRDLGQQVLQVFVDLQLVRLGGFHQAVNHRTGFGSVNGINDMPVGTSHRKGTDRTLRGSVVNGDPAVHQEHLQRLLVGRIVDAPFRSSDA